MSRQPLRLARHHDRLRSRHDCHAQPNHGESAPGVGPSSGRRNGFRRGRYPSKNEEAYDIYLRSIAVPHDPLPNKDAIAMLERAAGMDPSYAPSWSALGLRYYFDSQYSNGARPCFSVRTPPWNGSGTGSEPGRSAGQLTANEVERGELVKAYQNAKGLVERHPENGFAHGALAYVLATEECWRSLRMSATLPCRSTRETIAIGRAP